MTDSHETNHAADAQIRHADSVQFKWDWKPEELLPSSSHLHSLKDEDIERLQSLAAYDGILLTRSAIRYASAKRNDLPQVVRRELERLYPQTSVKECAQHLCQQAGLSEILTKASLHQLQIKIFETLSSHLERLRPGDVQTEVLIGWCSPKSSLNSSSVESVSSPTMDDSGRHSNVPPDSCAGEPT